MFIALCLLAASIPGPLVGTIGSGTERKPATVERRGDEHILHVGSPMLPAPPRSFTLSDYREEGRRVHFRIGRDGASLNFSGSLSDDPVLHTRLLDARAGPEHLALAGSVRLPPEALARHEGLYLFPDGTQAMVSIVPEAGMLMLAEYPSGELRGLTAASADTFFAGPGFGLPAPVSKRVSFEGGAMVLEEGGRRRRAGLMRFEREEVAFRNGPITLAGTLTRPNGPGLHPAVVLLHGGGPQTRAFGWVTDFFAARGVAVLAYDKRGVGGSTGDWRRATSSDLAGDALAGIDFLVAQRGIDRSRIGLYGSSNGGWSGPIAASFAPEKVAFLIVRSASGLPERENIVVEIESDLRAAGYGDDVVARMRDLHRRDIALLGSRGEGWNDFRAAVAAAAGEPWFPLIRIPANLMEMNETNRGAIEHWIESAKLNWADPAIFWPLVRAPVLVQLGGVDSYTPGPRSRDIIASALARGDNRRATVILYPKGDHGLFESATGSFADIVYVTRFAPGYLTDLSDWIERYVTVADPPGALRCRAANVASGRPRPPRPQAACSRPAPAPDR